MILKKVIYYLIFPFDVVFIFLTTLNKKIDARPVKGGRVDKIKHRVTFAKKLATYVGYDRVGMKYEDEEFNQRIEKYLND